MQPLLPETRNQTACTSVLVQTPVLVLCCPPTGGGVCVRVWRVFRYHLWHQDFGLFDTDVRTSFGQSHGGKFLGPKLSLKLVLNTVIFMVVGPLVYLFQAVLFISEHSSGIAKE